jgi:hypothetical protein
VSEVDGTEDKTRRPNYQCKVKLKLSVCLTFHESCLLPCLLNIVLVYSLFHSYDLSASLPSFGSQSVQFSFVLMAKFDDDKLMMVVVVIFISMKCVN